MIKLSEEIVIDIHKEVDVKDFYETVNQIIFSPSGNSIFYSTGYRVVRRDLESPDKFFSSQLGSKSGYRGTSEVITVEKLTISPDGKFLLVLDSGASYYDMDECHYGKVSLIDVESIGRAVVEEEEIDRYDYYRGWYEKEEKRIIFSVAIGKDFVATGWNNGEVRLYKINNKKEMFSFSAVKEPVSVIVFHPDDKWLLIGSRMGRVMLWEPWKSKKCIILDNPHKMFKEDEDSDKFAIRSAAFSKDGRLVAIRTNQGVMKVWSLPEYELKGVCIAPGGVFNGVMALSPCGRWIASGGRDGVVQIWSTESFNCLTSIKAGEKGVSAISFSPDSNLLATGCDDGVIRIWRISE
jgi:WD40 repeat protein